MWKFTTTGPFGFSAESTAEEVTQGIDGSGLVAIVTGATRGIGAETARVLALRGVHVIMAVRDIVVATNVKNDILKDIPGAKIDVMELDLSEFESVRSFASKFNSSGHPLNILINNAGTKSAFKLSKDNIDLTFATNHLGHFLLTNLLLKTMKTTSETSGKEGRIINISSMAHESPLCRGVRFNKLDNRPMILHYQTAYAISKLANILHANELARRLKEDGANITANSLHPGIVETDMLNEKHWLTKIWKVFLRLSIRNVHQGAATTCYLALHPQVKGLSGQYFSDCKLGKASSQACNIALGKELWDLSENLVNKN